MWGSSLMATKSQAIAALKKHHPDATLIDDDPHDGFSVQLEAPKGHHWDGDVHCKPCGFWYKGSCPKSEYWDHVIEEIGFLSPAVPCVDDDCEGIKTFGECEYWEEETTDE